MFMRRSVVLVCLLLAVLVQAVAQDAFPKVVECEMQSSILGCTKKYCVYLPAGYGDGSRKFPVLYLLHGLTDTHTAWRDRGRMADIATSVFEEGAAQEMVIVMPDAGTTYDGYFNIGDWHYEDFFFQEFIPHIEGKYRITADRQHRAIAGLSMGGGGTTGYAIRHSGMFSSAYAMSALMGMVENSWISRNADDRRTAFLRSVIENNNIEIIRNATGVQCKEIATVRWFIDVGDDDFLFTNNMDFVRVMREKRIPYQLRVREGGHSWQYWQEALRMALPFVSEGFGTK
jgi:S-formylglutathione hydrolase FrmB